MGPPHYVTAAKINNGVLRFEWDEWDVKRFYTNVDEQVLERLTYVNHPAQVAMAVAAAEWIAARFDSVSDDPMPWQYLEAAWAGVIDLHYVHYIETDDNEWRGPVRGPLNMAISITVDALFCADESSNPAENPAWMCALAQHVLPFTDQFVQWRDGTISRLEQIYPVLSDDDSALFPDDSPQPTPVVREAFDPYADFEPMNAVGYADNFLRNLPYTSNPFLRGPAELMQRGFRGTPYRFGR